MKTKTLVGFTVGLAVGFFLFKASALMVQKRFLAVGEFSINWNQIGMGEENFNMNKARRDYDALLAKHKVKKDLVGIVAAQCGLSQPQAAKLTKGLRNLKISRSGKNEDSDVYQVKFFYDDSKVARAVVELVEQRVVGGINSKERLSSAQMAASSLHNHLSARERAEELRDQIASESQQQSKSYSSERQERINRMRQELQTNDFDKTITFFQTLAGGVHIFMNPAKIQTHAIVTAI